MNKHIIFKLIKRIIVIAAVAVSLVGCGGVSEIPAAIPESQTALFRSGNGEIVYECEDGTFRLVSTFQLRGKGETDVTAECYSSFTLESEESIGANSYLYVLDGESGNFAAADFNKLVREVRYVETDSRGGGASIRTALAMGTPDDEAVFAWAAYNVRGGNEETESHTLSWEIEMKNDDLICMDQTLDVLNPQSIVISYKEYAMDTTEQLQAILDNIKSLSYFAPRVDIYLPPIVYEGGVQIHTRDVNLYGSSDELGGVERTTFKGTVSVYSHGNTTGCTTFHNIAFEAEGETGLLARKGVLVEGCVFKNCSIGAYADCAGWISSKGCTYAGNDIGIMIENTGTPSHVDTEYGGNIFSENKTAFRLEQSSETVSLSFPGSVFSGNKRDTVNSTDSELDISDAEVIVNK